MTTQQDDAARRAEATSQRRWLIGVAITVVFGGFGVVMALLSYADHTKAPTPGASSPSREPSPAPADEPRGKGKGHNK